MKQEIGGKRLGSGKKMEVHLKEYNRSTHNLGYPFRTTISPGTLVPFMSKVLTPGTTFDIDLQAKVLTLPTNGPLFGTFKYEAHVWSIPIRLYNALLQINEINIGKRMEDVLLPQAMLRAQNITVDSNLDNAQINPSCVLAGFGIRGLGHGDSGNLAVRRKFNITPWWCYIDIFKNYFANKQEDIAYVIHNDLTIMPYPTQDDRTAFHNVVVGSAMTSVELQVVEETTDPPTSPTTAGIVPETYLEIWFEDTGADYGDQLDRVYIYWGSGYVKIIDVFEDVKWVLNGDEESSSIFARIPKSTGFVTTIGSVYVDASVDTIYDIEPRLAPFQLDDIDKMKKDLYKANLNNEEFVLGTDTVNGERDYGVLTGWLKTMVIDGKLEGSARSNQEGLLVKTYKSDLFNNWMDTEYIAGPNGINELTKVGVGEDGFTINELNVKNKVYDIMNRIAVTDGSHKSYIGVTYSHYGMSEITGPVYEGGMSQTITFQEVISNATSASTEAGEQPLGTLAGRGAMRDDRKGGHVKVKVDEESYVIGITCITPIIDYSQGNAWDTNLKNLNELHKPGLDQIGFQDLPTDWMAYWDTRIDNDGEVHFKSAGKQPSWIHYQTSVPVIRGNFAMQDKEGFMILDRRYEPTSIAGDRIRIKDLTTYIDPKKYNYIFADTRRDAMNFWLQMGVGITARIKMSANSMPNL